jgi:Fe-S-cluster containining protein
MQCFRCGVCCVKFQAYLTLREAKKIARNMGLPWELWRAKYTDPRWPGTESLLIIHQNGACVFLERNAENLSTRCLIHDFEPSACSGWLAGWEKQECRDGLLAAWGLTIDRQGEIEGPAEKIREFSAFIASFSC